jgi:hypothetical protein
MQSKLSDVSEKQGQRNNDEIEQIRESEIKRMSDKVKSYDENENSHMIGLERLKPPVGGGSEDQLFFKTKRRTKTAKKDKSSKKKSKSKKKD